MPTCPQCQRTVGVVTEAATIRCPFCQREFSSSASGTLGAKPCKLCGEALTPLEAARGSVCSRSACQQQQLGAEAAARRIAKQEFVRKMTSRGQAFLQDQEDLPRDLPVQLAIVPVNTREITVLPPERKDAFLSHLRSVVAREHELREVADGELTTPYSVPEEVPDMTPAQDKTVGLACAVCRGHCCRQGVEHAFQDPPSMRRIRATFPDWSDQELIEQYSQRLPDETYDEACVFQTATGCNLPREMRSNMCNRWMCTGQHRWLEELPAEGDSLTYVIATPDYEPEAVRSALVLGGSGETAIREDIRD